MNKSVWILILALVMISFGIGYFFKDLASLTGVNIKSTGLAIQGIDDELLPISYSWTTALCGNNNKCLDVLVSCNGTSIMNITPISKLVEHEDDWKDPRGGNPDLCPKNGKG